MIAGILLQISQATNAMTDTMARVMNPATQAAEESISLWDLAEKGGPILIPIAFLSIAAVYIFFERFFTIRRFSRMDMNFMNQIRDHVLNGNIDAAKTLCKISKSPVSRMIEKGLTPVHKRAAANARRLSRMKKR